MITPFRSLLVRSALALLAFAFVAAAWAERPPLPDCRYDDVLTERYALHEWRVTLVDTIYRLPETYAPSDLAPVTNAGVQGNGELRAFVLDDLRAMADAARADGVRVLSLSAYRSIRHQEGVFAREVASLGRERALRVSARPGHSEHHLGTAIDFIGPDWTLPWNVPDWATTPTGRWLLENAPRYGFVMSYPRGKEHVVCYDYEPWHYRYVGREAAAEITDRGITLREWLWEQQ